MRIGIDSNSLLYEKKGIGWYLFSILEKFADLAAESDEFHLFWSSNPKNKPEIPDLFAKTQKVTTQRLLPFPKTVGLILSRIYRNFPGVFLPPLDIVHFPNFTAFPVKGAKIVITIHDLVFKIFPETIDYKNLWILNEFVGRSIRLADRVIAVSHATAADLIKFFPDSENKIVVIHQGVDHQVFCPLSVTERELVSILGTPRYILSLSTLEPRKNIGTLIKAYLTLLQNVGKEIPDLVLVGAKGWKMEELFKDYVSLPENLREKVRFTGYLPRELLPKVYSGCELFVFPSLYEGFGLPVLEAMACGAPVIASNSSSLPEVGGDAVVYINPLDIEGISQAIFKVINSSSLRECLRAKSLSQAKRFSWQKTAKETYYLYQQAVGT